MTPCKVKELLGLPTLLKSYTPFCSSAALSHFQLIILVHWSVWLRSNDSRQPLYMKATGSCQLTNSKKMYTTFPLKMTESRGQVLSGGKNRAEG